MPAYRGFAMARLDGRVTVPRLAWFLLDWRFGELVASAADAIDRLLDDPASFFAKGDKVTVATSHWGHTQQDNAPFQGADGVVVGHRETWDMAYSSFNPHRFNVVQCAGLGEGLFTNGALKHKPKHSAWPANLLMNGLRHWVMKNDRATRCDGAVVGILDSPETFSLNPKSKRFVAHPPGEDHPLHYGRGRFLRHHRRWQTAPAAMKAIDKEFKVGCRCAILLADSWTARDLDQLGKD